MMIKLYPSQSRYSGDMGWLQCNFSFSFADFQDPDNVQFGPLRVFNDDYIQPTKGFGTHPHRDMEIVTFALAGQLEHKDNTGGHEILKPGEVQRMSAGTGVLHSEINSSSDQVANTLQLWFLPKERGIQPSYEQRAYDQEAMVGRLLPVVSGRGERQENLTFIHQDLTIYMSKLEPGQSIPFHQEEGRRIYVFLIEGDLKLNEDYRLARRDAARITEVTDLDLASEHGAHLMLIDLP